MKKLNQYSILLTCEHAKNTIPSQYQKYFKNAEKLLQSHEGWDLGALDCFTLLSDSLSCESKQAEYSRLLIDLNRSLHHQKVFSKISNQFSAQQKKDIIDGIYQPYRDDIIAKINKQLKMNKPVLHLSIHSFTPKLHGQTRHADIGLLYDPQSPYEKETAAQLKKQINTIEPSLRVRMNYPYKGTSDGFTTFLRKRFNKDQYIGIEIELNQKHALTSSSQQLINQVILKAISNFLQISPGMRNK